jgi:hypothetical protein
MVDINCGRRIFLCHAHEDKEQVQEIYLALKKAGFNPWMDRPPRPFRHEGLEPGSDWDSEIRSQIRTADFLFACLSKISVEKRGYVQREYILALNQMAEVPLGDIFLIPVLLEDCQPPRTRVDTIDFHGIQWFRLYEDDIDDLIRFLERRLEPPEEVVVQDTLAHASDRAIDIGLYPVNAPFFRPSQYIGMTIADAAKAVKESPNDVGNIIVDSDQAHMVLEAEGNFVGYVDIELKGTAPCRLDQPFDSVPILGALSVNPAELELIRNQTHFHTYYDHKRRIKVGVSCQYDGGPLSVGFGGKYYGM